MRYFTLGAPPGRRGSAWLPGLPITPKALKWGFWGAPEQLEGQPGTKAVAAPDPKVYSAGRVSAVGGIFYSQDAPSVIYPSLYYVRGKQEHAPVSLLRTNNMPVPAVDLYKLPSGMATGHGAPFSGRIPMIAARTSRVGGRYQTGWPSAPVNWPWGNKAAR